MSDVKPAIVRITLGGIEYPMLFDINAVDDIQDRFDAPFSEVVSMLGSELTAYRAIKGVLHILIREGCEYSTERGEEMPAVPSEREIGKSISYFGAGNVIEQILDCISSESPDTSEDDDPNSLCGPTE